MAWAMCKKCGGELYYPTLEEAVNEIQVCPSCEYPNEMFDAKEILLGYLEAMMERIKKLEQA